VQQALGSFYLDKTELSRDSFAVILGLVASRDIFGRQARSSVKPRTNEDIAYERLKIKILSGELPRGEFLSQRPLAESVDTAVVTLRCCLRRLESEGLVESVPKWGVRIPVETRETIADRYFVREWIEAAAVDRIMERSDADARDRLMAAAVECDRVSDEQPDDVGLFSQRHFAFHGLVAELSGSAMLVRLSSQINLKSLLFRNARRVWQRGKDRVIHADLVESLYSSGRQTAIDLMRQHVRRGLAIELQALEEQPLAAPPTSDAG
jgi:GntR family transcriptional regulator, rspAB operon transcriptional repressor